MAPRSRAAMPPLAAYNYRVVVGSVNMRFAKVEGLVWERLAVPYRNGLSFRDGERLSLSRVDRYSSLTLYQGVMASDAALISWLRSGDARMLQVLLCNADGQPALVWQAARAVPVKLTGSSLDASSNEVFMDCLELQAAGWSIKSSA